MKTGVNENTLFVGNGFSRSLFGQMPSWDQLFDGVDRSVGSYTMMYEAYMLEMQKKGYPENAVKQKLIQKIREAYSGEKIESRLPDLACFGRYLEEHRVHNILTTNYDEIIEMILSMACGYTESEELRYVPEEVYSIRTYKEFIGKTGHRVKLWKIHGDVDRIKSVTLGYDQYCGSLARLSEYIKGEYAPAAERKRQAGRSIFNRHIIDKCRDDSFDNISWAELFFRTNVYIVGFGMEFSEIDIWWLLNKRARFMQEHNRIHNSITYFYHPKFDDPKVKQPIYSALKTFAVDVRPLQTDGGYLEGIFAGMC